MGDVRFTLSARERPISVAGYRRAARRALPDMVWTYVENGAEDEVTLAGNRAAFRRWSLRQRVLRGAAERKMAVNLEGAELSLPVMVSPTGLCGMVHWSGEAAVAAGAAGAGSRMVLSAASSYSLEEVAEASPAGHWFQIYPWRDKEFVDLILSRARRSGYRVLVLTVDVPVFGNREGERLRGMGIPPVLTPRRILDAVAHPRWAYGFLRYQRVSMRNFVTTGGLSAGASSARAHGDRLTRSQLDWDDFARVRALWNGPCYIKGILDPADAERAVSLGADGIVVSNHGGRQLDSAPATLDALPAIVDRVGSRATVLLDGGVRRGSDVVKALCLGAAGCLIGRPMIYGLAAGGAAGVTDVLEILRQEIDRTLALMGCADIADLERSWLIEA